MVKSIREIGTQHLSCHPNHATPCFSSTLLLLQNTGLSVSLNRSTILSHDLGSEVQNGSQQTENKLLTRMYSSERLREALMNIVVIHPVCRTPALKDLGPIPYLFPLNSLQ